MLTIGLTGGIGSGKSLVMQYFKLCGAAAINVDAINRKLLQNNPNNFQSIKQHFGNTVVTANNQLDRAKIKQIIFENPDKKKWLEQLLHPQIKQEMQKDLDKIDNKICIIEIPLLIEAGFVDYVERILVVDCSTELQISRVMNRDGLNQTQAQSIIATQLPREQRIAHADDIIENNREIEHLREKVESMYEFYLTLV